MRRWTTWLLIAIAVCAGGLGWWQQRESGPEPPVEPGVKLTVTGPPPAPAVAKLPPPPGLTEELPTYPAEPRPKWPQGLSGPSGAGGLDDLEALANQIERTGDPTPPEGAPAALFGLLPGGRYIYHLGGVPRPDREMAYLLQRIGEGWTATPLCPGARWFQVVDGLLLCASSEGSGAVLTLNVYDGTSHLLRLAGLQEGVFALRPGPKGPPEIVVTGKLQWMEHKLDPWVTERFTYAYQDGRYRQVKQERMADRSYHLARFIRLLAAGELARTQAEMAAPPPGGLEAYLEQTAPDLERLAGSTWTTDGFDRPGRVYIHQPRTEGPWFWFEFAPDDRIASLGQQEQPPTR